MEDGFDYWRKHLASQEFERKKFLWKRFQEILIASNTVKDPNKVCIINQIPQRTNRAWSLGNSESQYRIFTWKQPTHVAKEPGNWHCHWLRLLQGSLILYHFLPASSLQPTKESPQAMRCRHLQLEDGQNGLNDKIRGPYAKPSTASTVYESTHIFVNKIYQCLC